MTLLVITRYSGKILWRIYFADISEKYELIRKGF